MTCCGGIRELTRVKKLSRELAGLAPVPDEGGFCFIDTEFILSDFDNVAVPIKASPLDIEAFHQEISVKYPTFAPQHKPLGQPPEEVLPARAVQPSKLAQAYSPIPVRHHYEHDESDTTHGGLTGPGHPHGLPFHQANASSNFRGPQTATPAPTPPPSPKPKKQQFQTDQTRPFLFPFSRSVLGRRGSSYVPFAIDEADKLYNKHMYVSLSLWQMWRTREECMTAESGLDHMPGSERVAVPKVAPAVCLLNLRQSSEN